MGHKVAISSPALHDLQLIRAFIAKDSPTAAATFINKLVAAANSLAQFPFQGRVIGKSRGARFIVFRAYLIVYRIDAINREIRVLRSGTRPATFNA